MKEFYPLIRFRIDYLYPMTNMLYDKNEKKYNISIGDIEQNIKYLCEKHDIIDNKSLKIQDRVKYLINRYLDTLSIKQKELDSIYDEYECGYEKNDIMIKNTARKKYSIYLKKIKTPVYYIAEIYYFICLYYMVEFNNNEYDHDFYDGIIKLINTVCDTNPFKKYNIPLQELTAYNPYGLDGECDSLGIYRPYVVDRKCGFNICMNSHKCGTCLRSPR